MQPTTPQQPITPPSAPDSDTATTNLPPVSPVPTPKTIGSESAFPHKNRKKAWIISAAVVVVLALGGTAGAMWWSGPQKSFDDAMSVSQPIPKGREANGSLVITPENGSGATIDFDTTYLGTTTHTTMALKMGEGAVTINVNGAVATDASNNVYVKVNDVRKTLETFMGANTEMIDQYYGKLINKIDGKWVQITEADMKQLTGDSGADLTCMSTAIQKLTTDRSYLNELGTMYEKNKYISIKQTLPSEKVGTIDSHHYVLAIDATKLEAFDKAAASSKFVQEFKKCVKDDSSMTSETIDTTAEQPRVELWVDKWSHKVTKLMLTQDTDGSTVKMTMMLNYNDTQKVEVPKADTQFKDLQTELQSIEEMFVPTGTPASQLDLSQI